MNSISYDPLRGSGVTWLRSMAINEQLVLTVGLTDRARAVELCTVFKLMEEASPPNRLSPWEAAVRATLLARVRLVHGADNDTGPAFVLHAPLLGWFGADLPPAESAASAGPTSAATVGSSSTSMTVDAAASPLLHQPQTEPRTVYAHGGTSSSLLTSRTDSSGGIGPGSPQTRREQQELKRTAYYSLLTTHDSLLTTCYLPMTHYYLLLTAHYSMHTTYLLLTTYYLLRATYY